MSGRVIPFRRPPREPDDARRFDELTRVRDHTEALVVRSLLEAHGIRVVLRTHAVPSVYPFTVGEQAAVRVLVPREDVARGRRLLARPAPRAAGP